MTEKRRFSQNPFRLPHDSKNCGGAFVAFGGFGVGVTLSVMTALESPKSAECLPKAESYLPKELLYWILASPYPPHTPLVAHHIARQYRAGYAHILHLEAILGFGV